MPLILTPILEHGVRNALRHTGVRTPMVEGPAGRVHVYDVPGRGDLPTTVLLHGIGSAAAPFAPLLSRLRGHVRRIIAPEHPGHGFSDPPSGTLTPALLLESTTHVLDHLLGPTEPFVLVGNSLGGAVAVDYALKRADRVRALVLLSPAGASSSDEEWKELRASFEVPSRKVARLFLDRIYHRTPLLMRVLAHEIPAGLRRPAVRDLLATVTNEDAVDAVKLASLTMPILFLWGRSDRLLPNAHLAWWRKHLPAHAVIEEPEGMGHCPHLDAPRLLSERILAFLASTAPKS